MAPVRYHLGRFPPGPEALDWQRLVPLIGPANAALARYDGLIEAIPNADILLTPLTTQEAVLSSKIEGTTVTMGEVLEIEAGGDRGLTQPKREDAEEVLNYRTALQVSSKSIAERPLSLHLLREAHALLLQGVRGRDQTPGAFRQEQNWIGAARSPMEQASFVPIPQEHLQAGLETWIRYTNDTTQPDPLVQLALVHLEFEALHPFRDGNGRLGRMIIPLFLMQRKVLSSPSFYMSGYLERHRATYIDGLREVSASGAWTEWCVFFLQGLIEQAKENQEKAAAILALYQQMRREIAERTRSQFSDLAVDFLFSRPIFKTNDFVEGARIPRETAQRMLRVLREGDDPILQHLIAGAGRKPAILAFGRLLRIVEG